MRKSIIVSCVGLSLLFAGCGETDSPVGYWQGSGKANEVIMNDTFRHLTRSADFQFWFTLDEDGNAIGEIELDYDAKLTVKNIPQVTAPIPGGSITFAPDVGGQLTDLDPRRRFPIVGVLSENNELTMMIALEEGEREPLEFTLRGDVGVSAGLIGVSGGGIQTGGAGVGGARYGEVVHKIDMMPFSPFNGSTRITERTEDVYGAHFEEEGDNYAIEWSAHKVRSAKSEFDMKPEFETALRKLRDKLVQEQAGDDTSQRADSDEAEEAVQLSATLSPEFKTGDIIALNRIEGSTIANPGAGCKKRHLTAAPGELGIKIDSKGPFPDPNAPCHYGEIVPGI